MFSNWTDAEKASIRQLLRYAVAIFLAVAIALAVASLVIDPLVKSLGGDTTTSIPAESTPLATETTN